MVFARHPLAPSFLALPPSQPLPTTPRGRTGFDVISDTINFLGRYAPLPLAGSTTRASEALRPTRIASSFFPSSPSATTSASIRITVSLGSQISRIMREREGKTERERASSVSHDQTTRVRIETRDSRIIAITAGPLRKRLTNFAFRNERAVTFKRE